MQLIPSQSFAIVRQLDNVNDTNVYYVQAVVRNAATDAVLATVNLTSKGNQRFSSPYQVPADTSGTGMYISITSSVYTDSGYTQLSQTYATEDAEYLVLQPAISTYGNGGTTIVDYDKIRKFISDIKFPGIPTYDKEFKQIREYHEGRFDEIKGHVEKMVKGIKIPEPTPKYDDGELRAAIIQLQNQIVSMKNLHASALSTMSVSHAKEVEGLRKQIDEMGKGINSSLNDISSYNQSAANEHARILREGNLLKEKHRRATKELQYDEPKQEERIDTTMLRAKKLLGI